MDSPVTDSVPRLRRILTVCHRILMVSIAAAVIAFSPIWVIRKPRSAPASRIYMGSMIATSIAGSVVLASVAGVFLTELRLRKLIAAHKGLVCPKCGYIITEGADRCPECGRPWDGPAREWGHMYNVPL